MRRVLAVLVVLGALALALPGPAYAAPVADDQVVFGGDFVLESGEVLSGDLVLFGGNATLQEESRVIGDVFLMGGNVTVAGEVTGDVVLLGGNVELLPTANVHGDAVAIGGSLTRAAGARVGGQVVEGGEIVGPFEFTLPFDFRFPSHRTIGPFDSLRIGRSLVLNLVWFGFVSLLAAAVAVLVVMFWPEPTDRTGRAAIAQPILGGGLGFLTIVVAPFVIIMLAITILLFPVSIAGFVLVMSAGLFGWIALGLEVGKRLAEAFKWELQPPAAAGLGTLVLTLVIGSIGLILPCVGWLAPFLVASIGLGAVMLTRFGSREYASGAAAAPKPKLPPPPPPPPPEPPAPPKPPARRRSTGTARKKS